MKIKQNNYLSFGTSEDRVFTQCNYHLATFIIPSVNSTQYCRLYGPPAARVWSKVKEPLVCQL